MRVLGIDPGTATTGIAIVEEKSGNLNAIYYSCIKTLSNIPISYRLDKIFKNINSIILEFSPDCLAVEELFFSDNVKTALSVGQATGVILLTASQNNLEVYKYTPLQVKKAVVGFGNASKKQVQYMVKAILKIKDEKIEDDAADALATAICHLNWKRNKRIF
ncbi:MAG: crossover junction endodeoxyribonuclease RuvC [Actinomycetia bacterium]|nr:crossover junction endodeoxyribonuclease RuvC [Actinomycetes bacterium]